MTNNTKQPSNGSHLLVQVTTVPDVKLIHNQKWVQGMLIKQNDDSYTTVWADGDWEDSGYLLPGYPEVDDFVALSPVQATCIQALRFGHATPYTPVTVMNGELFVDEQLQKDAIASGNPFVTSRMYIFILGLDQVTCLEEPELDASVESNPAERLIISSAEIDSYNRIQNEIRSETKLFHGQSQASVQTVAENLKQQLSESTCPAEEWVDVTTMAKVINSINVNRTDAGLSVLFPKGGYLATQLEHATLDADKAFKEVIAPSVTPDSPVITTADLIAARDDKFRDKAAEQQQANRSAGESEVSSGYGQRFDELTKGMNVLMEQTASRIISNREINHWNAKRAEIGLKPLLVRNGVLVTALEQDVVDAGKGLPIDNPK
jgi:hypothetical protein